jgi:carbonic anhydrase
MPRSLIVLTSRATMSASQSRTDRVLTKEEQESLHPDEVLALLREGNARFVSGDVTHRDHRAQVRHAALGQWPKAVVLSCLDSRIPVEDVFDCGIGDLFVARVAGNIVNTDILGSMEFACAASGAKLVFVLGHEHCGAVKGAIDGVKLGNLTSLLDVIAPAADEVTGFDGARTSKNEAFVHCVAQQNVLRMLKRIRQDSPTLRDLETQGRIRIAGGMYDMHSGKVIPLE